MKIKEWNIIIIIFGIVCTSSIIMLFMKNKKINYYKKMWIKSSNANIRLNMDRARLKMYDYIFNYMDAKYPDIYAECYDVAKWANPYYQETNK